MKGGRPHRSPPVGVLAKTQNLARSFAREWGIKVSVPFSPVSEIPDEEIHLSALLVDESAWPLNAETRKKLMPLLERHGGYIIKMCRFDPKRLTFEENLV